MNRCVFFILVFKIEYIFILKEVLDVKINIRPLLSRQGHTLYRIRVVYHAFYQYEYRPVYFLLIIIDTKLGWNCISILFIKLVMTIRASGVA